MDKKKIGLIFIGLCFVFLTVLFLDNYSQQNITGYATASKPVVANSDCTTQGDVGCVGQEVAICINGKWKTAGVIPQQCGYEENNNQVNPPPITPDEPKNNLWIIIIIIVILILAVVGVIIYFIIKKDNNKRNNSKFSPKRPPIMPQRPILTPQRSFQTKSPPSFPRPINNSPSNKKPGETQRYTPPKR
jgi:hypothetical protein